MEADSGISIKELRVDGGATTNNLLMQFQADLLGADVIRPRCVETTGINSARRRTSFTKLKIFGWFKCWILGKY